MSTERETADAAALRLLQQQLGAVVVFGPPSPHLPAELLEGEEVRPQFVAPLQPLCCGGWRGPGDELTVCADCPGPAHKPAFDVTSSAAILAAGRPAPMFLAPAAGGPCTTPGCGGSCGYPEIEHDTITYVSPSQQLADQARGLAARAALTGQPVAVPSGFSAPAKGEPARYSDELWQELTRAVRDFCLNDPRSLQVEIGPSEIGHKCAARVTRTALGVEKTNLDADPWAAFVGTATHERLAKVFDWVNRKLEREHYLIERKVYASDGIFGSCDLFRDGVVIDHKIVGNDTMKELKSAGWEAKGGAYSRQLDIYGLGWERAGVEITEVALAAWPRSGFLDGLHVMRRPWDKAAAEGALERLSQLVAAAVDPAVDCDQDAFWETVPVAPSKQCGFCAWFDPNQDPDVPTRSRCGAGRAARNSSP